MVQMIGWCVIVAAVLGLLYYVWTTWFKGASVGVTPVGKFITGALESAQLTTNLGYVELLSRVDVVESSEEAVKACDVLSSVLWQGAMAAWRKAQTDSTTTVTTDTAVKTAKITAVDGTVVEVPIQ